MKIPAFFDFLKPKVINLNYTQRMPENFTGVIKWEEARICYYKKGKYHREGGPAIVYPTALKYWCFEGKPHRTDGPAIEYSNMEKEWCIEGNCYTPGYFKHLLKNTILVEVVKSKYNLYWYRFFTDEGIQEFPIIPGMDKDPDFKEVFKNFLTFQKE